VRDFLLALVRLDAIERVGEQSKFEDLWRQCNSGERAILQIIKDENLRLPDRHHHVITVEGIPAIEADFFYEPLDIVLVHGSVHHLKYVQAMDAEKERKVKAAGYRVTTLAPTDTDGAKAFLRQITA
jgi:hypothetical protein